MKIKLICFNKINKEFKEPYEFYINKIQKHCDLEIIEISEFEHWDIKSNMIKNEQIIFLKLKELKEFKNFEIFLLDIKAKQYSSEEIAKLLEENKNYKGGNICLIIGPSDGFSKEFKSLYQNKISFGLITLPYNLVRIVLLEQIYRGFKISKNHKYHK